MNAQGTVGWGDDPVYYEKGSDDNDGYTLVRVTLFDGRNPATKAKPGVAQGHRVLCHILGGSFRIPPIGKRVAVMFADGMGTMPGAGVIVGVIEKSPTIQFNANRVKIDYGEDVDLTIKARSVTLTDYTDQFLNVGPDGGVQFFDETGSGIQVKSGSIAALASDALGLTVHSGGAIKSAFMLGQGEAAIACGPTSNTKWKPTSITGFSPQITWKGICFFGPSPTLLTTAITTILGAPSPSATVFISA